MHIALAQINPILGNLDFNVKLIKEFTDAAIKKGAELIVFPELCIVGYYSEDLTKNRYFLSEVGKALDNIVDYSKEKEIGIILSFPNLEEQQIYNQGVLIYKGAIQDGFRKEELPNYGVFDEKRIFTATASEIRPLEFKGVKWGFMICEDMWTSKVTKELKSKGAEVLVVINASPFEIGKFERRVVAAEKLVKQAKIPLLYVNTFGGQDEIVLDGGSFILDSQAKLINEPVFWQESIEYIAFERGKMQVNHESPSQKFDTSAHIYQALMVGLGDYLYKNKFSKVVLGLSGGIDSAFVAVLAADAIGAKNVRCIRLPSKYTSQASNEDAYNFAQKLGCQLDDLSIENIFDACLNELKPIFVRHKEDITEENLQARIRSLLLMAVSNKFGEILLATSNKSESATGYTTLYGDMSGGFAPIKDIYKTQIYELVEWRNKNIPFKAQVQKLNLISNAILAKPPTAELKYNQTDQDTLPPYEVLDRILYKLIEGDKSPEELKDMGLDFEVVCRVQQMLYASEYKRRQAPIGTKINRVSLSKDRRYPITNQFLSRVES